MATYIRINGNKKQEVNTIQSTTGVTDADKIISTDATGKIDPSFLPESETAVKEAFEDLDALDFVNIFSDGGTEKVRKADGSLFSTRAHGIVLNNFLDGENATVVSEGIIGGFTGLTIGDPVFLSTTSGDVTQTPPTGTDEVWQKVGDAYSATEIRLEIGEAICRA
jgi:hypothetical protein